MLEKVFSTIITESEKNRGILEKIKMVILSFVEKHSPVKVLTVIAQVVASEAARSPDFYGELVEIMGDILTHEEKMEEIRCTLAEQTSHDGQLLFSVLYPAMCYSPSSAILLCYLSRRYKLAWLLIHKL